MPRENIVMNNTHSVKAATSGNFDSLNYSVLIKFMWITICNQKLHIYSSTPERKKSKKIHPSRKLR